MPGSEDFSEYIKIIPGAMFGGCTGPGPFLHTPHYDFNDDILPTMTRFMVGIAEECQGWKLDN